MKKSTILLFFTLTAVGFANAEDVTTSGNGVTYTLESLSTTENSGVTKNGKVYTLTNSITIAEGDRFEIESGATMKMGDGVQLRIEGTANFAATDRVLVTRADENAAPKGIYMVCDASDTEFKNIDFEYAGLRNFSSTGLTVANCTFRYNNGKMTTTGALAIGSGGLFGVGLGNSYQKHLWLPEPQNDFIFSIVCEELGLVGAVAVIVLFIVLIWRGFVIAMNAPDTFSSLLVIGLISKVGIQLLLNIAVVTVSIPTTGIALPFFSYGGSALIMQLGEMGIILSISKYSSQKPL